MQCKGIMLTPEVIALPTDWGVLWRVCSIYPCLSLLPSTGQHWVCHKRNCLIVEHAWHTYIWDLLPSDRGYKSYRTHGIVKNKIESFISRFSIFYDSMSSDCDLSHVRTPRNPRLVTNNILLVFRSQTSEIKFVTTLTCRVCDQGPYLHPSSLVEHSLHALEFAPDDLLMNGVNLLLK